MEHFELGVKYLRGDGIDCDLGKAAQHFRDAAAGGNPRAKFNLGLMYLKGSGVEYDCEEALKWLREAAREGHPGARLALSQYFSQFDCREDSSVMLHSLHVSIENEDARLNNADVAGEPSQAAPESMEAEVVPAAAKRSSQLKPSHAFFIVLVAILLGTMGIMGAMTWIYQSSLPSEQVRPRAQNEPPAPSPSNSPTERK